MIQPFSFQWFKKYQKLLLLYANTLGRDRLQIPSDKKIVKIYPHAVTWLEDKYDTLSTAFYPRTPFADALKMDLYPFWKILHAIDTSPLAQKLSFNFGFDTLTKYPDAHDEVTTVDGYARRYISSGEVFATLRGSVGTDYGDSGTTGFPVRITSYGGASNKYSYLYRGFILFLTSALTSLASISATTLSFNSSGAATTTCGDTNLCLVTSAPASNIILAASDFQGTWGSTNLYATPFAMSTIANGYRTDSISAAGRALISLIGVTKFGLMLGWDMTGDSTGLTWASGTNHTLFTMFFSDYGTPASYSPKLVVTYTLPKYLVLTGEVWKAVSSMKVLTAGAWKDVTAAKQLVAGVWKTIF